MNSKMKRVSQPSYTDTFKFESTDDENSAEFADCGGEKTPKAKYKTQMCKNFSENGYCPYFNKCQFAHGQEELFQQRNIIKSGYRTRKCKPFWEKGNCRYGRRCQFSHYQKTKCKGKNVMSIMKALLTSEERQQGSKLDFLLNSEFN